MTKTVEDVRRELFEARMDALDKNPGLWLDGGYSNVYGQCAWIGFNAALDAVEIQLPGAYEAMKAVFDYQHGPSNKNVTGTTNWAANVGMVVVDDCRSAIEQTGLGLKVLP